MRKLLLVFGFFVAGTASLASFTSMAHADQYPCPISTFDRLMQWQLACYRICHIVEKDKVKYKACQDKCGSDFVICDNRRKEILKEYGVKN